MAIRVIQYSKLKAWRKTNSSGELFVQESRLPNAEVGDLLGVVMGVAIVEYRITKRFKPEGEEEHTLLLSEEPIVVSDL